MIRILVNPSSGVGFKGDSLGRVPTSVEVTVSTDPQNFLELVEKSVRPTVDHLVLVGGDGTLNMAVQALMKMKPELRPKIGISRSGTGSDYARGLGIERHNWAKTIWNHHTKRVDVGCVMKDHKEPHYFMNTCSIGMSAEIAAKRFEISSWTPRQLRYLLPTLKTLPHLKPFRTHFKLPSREWTEDVLAVFSCKGPYLGGGMKWGSTTQLNDGLLDFKWIRPMNAIRALTLLPRVYGGQFQGISEIGCERISEIELSFDSQMLMETDGEVSRIQKARISVESGALEVCLPALH